jgi:hypothetical protein
MKTTALEHFENAAFGIIQYWESCYKLILLLEVFRPQY